MINFIEEEQLSINEKDRIKILASQMARLGLDNDITLKTLTQLEENKYKRNQSNNSIDMFTPTPTPTPSHSTFNRNNNKRYSINSSEQKDFFTTTAGQIEEKEEKEEEEEFEPGIVTRHKRSRSTSKNSKLFRLTKSPEKKEINTKTEKSITGNLSTNDIPQKTTLSPIKYPNNYSQNDISDNQSLIEGMEILFIKPGETETFYSDDNDELSYHSTGLANIKVHKRPEKLSLYEREKKHMEYKERLLSAKREKQVKEITKELKPNPEINKNKFSQLYGDVLNNNKDSIALYQRAGQIHSQKLMQINLYNQKKKVEEKLKEEQEEREKKMNCKIFNQNNWDNFVEKQMQWKQYIEYKKQAAEFIKNENEKQSCYDKPKINDKSKKMNISSQTNSNNNNNVYDRLYIDKEEHDKRQKLREINSLPSFQPKINRQFKRDTNNSSSLIYNSSNKFFQDNNSLENHTRINSNITNKNNYNTNELSKTCEYESIKQDNYDKSSLNNSLVKRNLLEKEFTTDEQKPEIVTCLGLDEMFAQQQNQQSEKLCNNNLNNQNNIEVNNENDSDDDLYNEDDYYKDKQTGNFNNNNNEDINEPIDFNSLYKINVRNTTPGREIEDKVIPSQEHAKKIFNISK